MRVSLETPDLSEAGQTALEAEWRALEAVADGSFFQSWTWVGCRLAERFTRPLLARATVDGSTVGLALFNRHPLLLARRAVFLQQTGRADEDSVFVEHAGPLVAPPLVAPPLAAGAQDATAAILQAALRRAGTVVLAGVGEAVRTAAESLGACRVTAMRPAPFARLQSEELWLAGLSASTRYQLRRSLRRHEARGLAFARAATPAEGLGFLAELARLHQASWIARGKPGAFAREAFGAFHRDLVARGLPRGEVELWRLSAGGRTAGVLYNLRWRGRVYAYQSGFDTEGAGPHEAPGLTCHHLAIRELAAEAARNGQCRFYDFLAGESRYKTSLATDRTILHWFELTRRFSMRSVASEMRRCFTT